MSPILLANTIGFGGEQLQKLLKTGRFIYFNSISKTVSDTVQRPSLGLLITC